MGSYKIEWKNSAYKELQKLPRPMISKVVAAVGDLSSNPYPVGVKKLIGSEYRLVIEIVRVRHRKDVYR